MIVRHAVCEYCGRAITQTYQMNLAVWFSDQVANPLWRTTWCHINGGSHAPTKGTMVDVDTETKEIKWAAESAAQISLPKGQAF